MNHRSAPVKTREEEPPSPPSPGEAAAEPEAPPGERTALAARLLGSLARTEPRLELGADDALRLAPLVEEWWAAGASSAQVRAALTQGLPRPLYSPRAIIKDRLTRKRPVAPSAPSGPVAPSVAAQAGASAGSTAVPVTTVEIRKPGASGGYREAARRGGAEVRALLLQRRRPASA